MKVALIGATGMVGSRILAELARRGHTVTGIVRHPEKVPDLPGVTPMQGDVYDETGLAALLKGHDAAISSVHFTASDRAKLLAAVRACGVKRYLVGGGAGSLEVAPGVKLIDTPEFPAIYKTEAQAGAAYLDLLRKEPALDWTYLSPSALIAPGERTAKFRLGAEQLLVNEKGSSISPDDYAIPLRDEIEKPPHSTPRF